MTFRAIETKDELVAALTEAAKLEHLFMGQYLFAALSLKKSPDERCDAAQFEHVRRWAQRLYAIARQEMEHLSIVNSVLTAIGAAPYFGHPGYPGRTVYFSPAAQRERHGDALDAGLEPCEIPFLLERFSLRTARRFTCMESPPLRELSGIERAEVVHWGFHGADRGCDFIVPPLPPLAAPPDDIEVGTIEQLYTSIVEGLLLLRERLGEQALFSGHDSGQAELPSEYQIFLFTIVDTRSAVAALQLVMQQGEGLNAPPGFDSHFLNYDQIAREYAELRAASPQFEPSLPLLPNPTLDSYTDPDAHSAAALFNDGYATLLLMLTGYYGLFDPATFNKKPSYLTAALEYNAFAPMMTMFVRTLGEILTGLPARSPADGLRAAPVFNLEPAVQALLATRPTPDNFYGRPGFYAERLQRLVVGIERLAASPTLPPAAATRFEFMRQNISRLAANFNNIDDVGIYKPWAPSQETT